MGSLVGSLVGSGVGFGPFFVLAHTASEKSDFASPATDRILKQYLVLASNPVTSKAVSSGDGPGVSEVHPPNN